MVNRHGQTDLRSNGPRPPTTWPTLKNRTRSGLWSAAFSDVAKLFIKKLIVSIFGIRAFLGLRVIYRKAKSMTNHYLRTELRSDLEAVELAWDGVLRFDGGPADRALVEPLLEYFRRQPGTWVLLGVEGFAKYLAHFDSGTVAFEEVTIPSQGALSEAEFRQLMTAARERLSRG